MQTQIMSLLLVYIKSDIFILVIESDDNFFYVLYQDGYIIGDGSMDHHNGLKNLDLVECIIPKKFKNKNIIGLNYRSFHSSPNIEIVFIPKNIHQFFYDSFACCNKLREFIFEDGFKGIHLGGYTLFQTNISSFVFPIGSQIIDEFFSESKIKNIYIFDFMTVNENPNLPVFRSCPQEINIFVPENYPYDQFCGRNVRKILPSYFKYEKTYYNHHCLIFSNQFVLNLFIYVFILI